MDLVAALRQLQSQFRRHNTAATVGGITRDSNLHQNGLSTIAFICICVRSHGAQLYSEFQRLDGSGKIGIHTFNSWIVITSEARDLPFATFRMKPTLRTGTSSTQKS